MSNCPYCASLKEKYPDATLRECKRDMGGLDSFTVLHQPKKTTSARVFIHPRCYEGPSSGALISYLQGRGYNLNAISIGPADTRGYCELVWLRATDPDGLLHLERMDGGQFEYRPSVVTTGGTAA